MSFVRGERVNFDFESGAITSRVDQSDGPSPAASTNFVGEILERPLAPAHQPTAPTFRNNLNGFPGHKKRTPGVSAFRRKRATKPAASGGTSTSNGNEAPSPTHRMSSTTVEDEKKQIDEENRQRLAGMSEHEIEDERNELLQNLSPSLIQKLLGRANLDDGSNERDLGLHFDRQSRGDGNGSDGLTSTRKKDEAFVDEERLIAFKTDEDHHHVDTANPWTQRSVSETEAASVFQPHTGLSHFPTPPQPPDLDPNDPNFLQNMHDKYFPSLPYDPSTLSWMAPIDPSDESSPYHPSQTAFNASDLRFDFRGALLAPSAAREIPVTKGLHHHANAPEAAGYTIPELAAMARSTVPAQRCIAFQTLGRFLYRLGRGEFGFEKVRQKTNIDGPVKLARDPNQTSVDDEVDEDDVEVDMEDAGSAMAAGLWHCVEEGMAVETLTEEAAKEKGHLTSRTFAQEALWNWRRGGGRRRQAI